MSDDWRNYDWLRKVARAVARIYAHGDPGLLDEYTQEGVIAGWEVLEKADTKALVRLAVVRRIYKCVTTGTRLGSERDGRGAGGAMTVASVESLDAMPWDGATSLDVYPVESGWLSDALPNNTDLRVAMLLGVGYRKTEIASELGVTEGAIRFRIQTRIRPALATYLEREAA